MKSWNPRFRRLTKLAMLFQLPGCAKKEFALSRMETKLFFLLMFKMISIPTRRDHLQKFGIILSYMRLMNMKND